MAHLTHNLFRTSVLVACTRQPAFKTGDGFAGLSVALTSRQAYINQCISDQVWIPSLIGVLDPGRRPASHRRSRTAVARPLRVRGITRPRPAIPQRPPAGWSVSRASSEVLPDHDVGRIAMVPAMRVREQRWP